MLTDLLYFIPYSGNYLHILCERWIPNPHILKHMFIIHKKKEKNPKSQSQYITTTAACHKPIVRGSNSVPAAGSIKALMTERRRRPSASIDPKVHSQNMGQTYGPEILQSGQQQTIGQFELRVELMNAYKNLSCKWGKILYFVLSCNTLLPPYSYCP